MCAAPTRVTSPFWPPSALAPSLTAHIDRPPQRFLSVIRTSARGGRVDTKRIGGLLERRHLRGGLTSERQDGEHLPVTQFGRPGQQVSDQ